jgi:hypothetical protein
MGEGRMGGGSEHLRQAKQLLEATLPWVSAAPGSVKEWASERLAQRIRSWLEEHEILEDEGLIERR